MLRQCVEGGVQLDLKGEGLKDVDGGMGFGVSDPFVEIVYRKRDRTTVEFKTERVDDDLNPVFGYEFSLDEMTALELRDGSLQFLVKDWNLTGAAELGHADLALGELEGTESTRIHRIPTEPELDDESVLKLFDPTADSGDET